MPATYLLDTGVLLLLVRGGEVARNLDAAFGLRASTFRPLICCVSVGELWALAEMNNYGAEKRGVVQTTIDNTVVVDINDPVVVACYVEIYKALRGLSRTMGQNDMWIAAAARAANATLLTVDRDFDPLHPDVITRELIERPSSASSDR